MQQDAWSFTDEELGERMSEEKSEYMGETPENQTYEICDEAPPRGYYSQIPNIVDEMGLTPYAYRLYGHLRRRAGETGQCWENTENLAKSCGMSTGKISEAKQELENVYPPLIRVTSKKKDDGRIYHSISITDVWQVNQDFFEKKTVHVVKGEARSPGETYRSRGERKNIPLNQEEPPQAGDQSRKDPRTEKRGDFIDGMKDLYNMPGAKIAVLKEHVESRVKVRLSLNPSGRDGRAFVDHAARAKKSDNQDIDKFIDWWLANNPEPKYWSFSRMIERWNMAFTTMLPSAQYREPARAL